MSFQAYLDNIQAKTGKSPADFRRLGTDKGFAEGGKLKADVKAGVAVAWLKADFALGHGDAMTIVASQCRRSKKRLWHEVSLRQETQRAIQIRFSAAVRSRYERQSSQWHDNGAEGTVVGNRESL